MTSPFLERPVAEHTASNELAFAIEDRFPVTPGHTLVVTRRLVPTWFDATPEEQAALMALVNLVKQQLDQTHHPAGFNVGFNAGEAAGQTVPHLHVHVIPRYRGDMADPRGGVRGVIPSQQKYGDEEDDPFAALAIFVPGQEEALLRQLRTAIGIASEIDVLSAFVQLTGLDELEDDLVDALDRGAHVRVLTGDYLQITHPHALQRLFALTSRYGNLEARMYRVSANEAFHPKAYMFARGRHGAAFVGSSNLSRSALTVGVEWNLKAAPGDTATFRAIRGRFTRLFDSPRAQALSPAMLAEYQGRVPVPPAPEPAALRPEPHAIQREVLVALRETRALGETRGLVVMATGLGKTLLAGFDFGASGGRKALFVAHRDEILVQAAESWGRVLPDLSIGFLNSGHKELTADLVFASVATLAQRRHLHAFAPDHFDYIVIDEFHHAAAASYRKLLEHFRPAFLLGLTATPDRMDGAPLLELCEGNEVARVGVYEGITRGFLAPFQYHGIADQLDYSKIPWRSGRFDLDTLTAMQSTRERAAQALREYRRHAAPPRRALVFCCSQGHADFIAAYFREHGVSAAAVHSGPKSSPRADSIRKLRAGDLEALVAVDLFNEGFDVPDVDVILMLRPTESPIVFLQQLGRGLRKGSVAKTALRVIDFIGNHRSFLAKPRVLATLAGMDLSIPQALQRLRDHELPLPPDCTLDIETAALDILDAIAGGAPTDALIYAYERFRSGHGRRPTACELLSENGTLKPAEQRFGTWFQLVGELGDLTGEEQEVLDAQRDWFADLTGTPMSRSYKMVALQVLDDMDGLHGEVDVREFADRCRERLRRDRELLGELHEHEQAGGALDDFARRWREMPLRVFHDAKGFKRRWFTLAGTRFTSNLDVAPHLRERFDAMTAELVEYRLADYLLRRSTPVNVLAFSTGFQLEVSHSSGKPILRFDRDEQPGLPTDEVTVEIDGEPLLLRFKKIAVNVALERQGGPNVLGERMRRWFGPKAGLPGTRHRVDLRQTASGTWQLRRQAATKPVVRLPFYEMQVACGVADPQFHAPTPKLMAVLTEREVDVKRHFLVRAAGNSMDGGLNPIRDGDLVLCEWVKVGNPTDFAGRAVLVSSASTDDFTASIKVPVEVDGVWKLRSTNPAFPDLPLDPAQEISVAARVLDTLEPALVDE